MLLFFFRSTQARKEKETPMDHIHHYRSPLGGITLASDGQALIGLWFDGQKNFGETLAPEYTETSLPVFDRAEEWLNLYFSGKSPDFTPALLLRGTSFRKTVWEILPGIPYGQTLTYSQIAEKVAGRTETGRMSARAVGSAISHNPISLIIPCHRVMGAGGRPTGYAGGIDRKIRLLQLEQADPGRLIIP